MIVMFNNSEDADEVIPPSVHHHLEINLENRLEQSSAYLYHSDPQLEMSVNADDNQVKVLCAGDGSRELM
jgi:hypothetical protein